MRGRCDQKTGVFLPRCRIAHSFFGHVDTPALRNFRQSGEIIALAAADVQNRPAVRAKLVQQRCDRLCDWRIKASVEKFPPRRNLLPCIAGVQRVLLCNRQQIDITLACYIEGVTVFAFPNFFRLRERLPADGTAE